MTLKLRSLVVTCVLAGSASALVTGCPGPRYPVCKNDDQCRRELSQKTFDEYCVVGKCQQCAEHSHCPPDERCVSGRCDPAATAATKAPAAAAPPTTTTATKDAPAICDERATVRFDFNSAALRDDARAVLDALARCYIAPSAHTLVVEGHCDERGTTEYNLALGERRAEAIRAYLTRLGVPLARIRAISYGEERPLERAASETAWTANRRAELLRHQ